MRDGLRLVRDTVTAWIDDEAPSMTFSPTDRRSAGNPEEAS